MIEGSALRLAGTYRRRVNASLERIWENVFDWEHLAHLHDGSFSDCALVDSGPWGWRVDLTARGGTPQRIELRADRAAGRYVSTTIGGTTKGTEIRVALEPIATMLVDVTVEFHLPESRLDRLAALGEAYSAVYARLWDEDEVMMQERERALVRRKAPDRTAPPLDLGDEPSVRARLPVQFELGGTIFRLVDHEGMLFAHSTVCPHWLGPLDGTVVADGSIRCPWHGYVFDVVDGRCRSHPALNLATAPSVRLAGGRVVVEW